MDVDAYGVVGMAMGQAAPVSEAIFFDDYSGKAKWKFTKNVRRTTELAPEGELRESTC